jgi:hypothetical protein
MYTLRFQQNNGERIQIFRALSPHWRPKIALITSVSLFVLRVMIQPEHEICCFRLLCIFPCSFVGPEAKHMDSEIKTLLLTVLEKPQEEKKVRNAFAILMHLRQPREKERRKRDYLHAISNDVYGACKSASTGRYFWYLQENSKVTRLVDSTDGIF